MDHKKRIKEKAEIEEAYLVSSLYQTPDQFAMFTKAELNDDMFMHKPWKFYFGLARQIYEDGVRQLDDVMVLKKVKEYGATEEFNKYGGFQPIHQVLQQAEVSVENFDDYKRGIRWNHTMREMAKLIGAKVFEADGKYDPYKMKANQIALYWQDKLNRLMMMTSENMYDSEKLVVDAEQYIEEIETQAEGMLPFFNGKKTNKAVGGWSRGNVTMFGGYGNTGKSSISVERVVLGCIKAKEKLVILANEEGGKAWRDKIYKYIIFKKLEKKSFKFEKLTRGGLDEDEKQIIREATEELRTLVDGDDSLIQIVYLQNYIVEDVKTLIKHYAARGCINFMIDTHKVSDEKTGEQRYAQFVEDTKQYYKIARKDAGGLNLRVMLNFQLAEHTKGRRYLDNDMIGEGKAAKDEAAVVMMFRNTYDEELEGGKNELLCWDWRYDEMTEKTVKVEFKLKREKHYKLLFVSKNRFGATNDGGQEVIVLRSNFDANSFWEEGYTYVPKNADGHRR